MGVRSETWWQHRPGERVQTVEGFPGVVQEVVDGPRPGDETYVVDLDDGQGGGEYRSSELSPLATTAAQTASRDVVALEQLASTWYPELGTALVDHPPPPLAVPGRGRLAHRLDVVEEPDTSIRPEAGWVQNLVAPPTSEYSYDWCRFREANRCFYPKGLDPQATQLAGYAVWQPVDRGRCPRTTWAEQEQCPVGAPGENVQGGYVDAHQSWQQGGQRGGVPVPGYRDPARYASTEILDRDALLTEAALMRSASHTYTVTTPDGVQHTRNSERAYTHAVQWKRSGPNGDEYGVVSYHGTEPAARRGVASPRYNEWPQPEYELSVVPVDSPQDRGPGAGEPPAPAAKPERCEVSGKSIRDVPQGHKLIGKYNYDCPSCGAPVKALGSGRIPSHDRAPETQHGQQSEQHQAAKALTKFQLSSLQALHDAGGELDMGRSYETGRSEHPGFYLASQDVLHRNGLVESVTDGDGNHRGWRLTEAGRQHVQTSGSQQFARPPAAAPVAQDAAQDVYVEHHYTKPNGKVVKQKTPYKTEGPALSYAQQMADLRERDDEHLRVVRKHDGKVLFDTRTAARPGKQAAVRDPDLDKAPLDRRISDWDAYFPEVQEIGEIHRGLRIWPTQYHPAVTRGIPAPVMAQHFLDVIAQHPDGAGRHWSTNRTYAEGLAEVGGAQQRQVSAPVDAGPDLPVVLHAATPDREHLETDKATLNQLTVTPYDDVESEVPLSKHAPVRVSGISWMDTTQPGWARDRWVHHQFGEPVELPAYKPRAAGPRRATSEPPSRPPASGSRHLAAIEQDAAEIHALAGLPHQAASVEDYGIHHRPDPGDGPLHDAHGSGVAPPDFYEHPEYYGGHSSYGRESGRVMRRAQGNPDYQVTLYRAAPADITHINTGDWVALSKEYAQFHKDSNGDPDWKIHQIKAPARDVHWGGNDVNEWGYWGPSVPVIGRPVHAAVQDDTPAETDQDAAYRAAYAYGTQGGDVDVAHAFAAWYVQTYAPGGAPTLDRLPDPAEVWDAFTGQQGQGMGVTGVSAAAGHQYRYEQVPNEWAPGYMDDVIHRVENGQDVGSVRYLRDRPGQEGGAEGGPSLAVYQVAVPPEHRGRGVETGLLEELARNNADVHPHDIGAYEFEHPDVEQAWRGVFGQDHPSTWSQGPMASLRQEAASISQLAEGDWIWLG